MNPLCFRLLLVCFLVWFCPLVGFGQFVQMGNELLGNVGSPAFGSYTSISQDGKVTAISAAITNLHYGDVYVYEWHNNNWMPKGGPIRGENIGDNSGSSTDLSANGNTIIIGAPNNSNNGSYAGYTRVYEWDGTNWIQKGMDIEGDAAYNSLGYTVSINANGNIIAVGAPLYDGIMQNVGHVRIYEWDGTNWIQKGMYIEGSNTGDTSGESISLSANGNIIAIGAVGYDGIVQNTGHVRIYEWDGTNWIQKGIDLEGDKTNDGLGVSVSMSTDGNTVVAGAMESAINGKGYVKIFQWNGTNWIQKGTNIEGENFRDYLGSFGTTGISDNGNILVLGSPNNDSNGNASGHARIYEWNGTNWVQRGPAIVGESGDALGKVSISGDGSIVVIGSKLNDNGGLNVGNVRVFKSHGVYGFAYLDLNQNCYQDSLEAGTPYRQLIINPGNIIVQTNENGHWGLDSLPIGTYTITTDTTPNNNYQPCAPTYTFTIMHPDSITQTPSIGYQATQQCTSPSTAINMPFRRPGFSNQKVYIQACNDFNATTVFNNAYVIFTLDSLLTIDTASKIYTSLGSNTYQVNIGDLYPGQCATFWLECTLSQNAILGSSLCMEAKLYPIDSCALDSIPNTNIGLPCTTAFDGSHLAIYGNCDNNDTISFTITNTEADMSCVSEVRLYIDGILVRTDSIQLLSNQSQVFSFAGDGRTWRMEVDQHPLHWGNSQPSATIELCGNPANWTPNLVNILPHDDADPVVDIFCGLVTGSYDPNDKTGFPTGIGTSHDILPNQKIEYRIRFQNTGTDTAFTVVIRDTLSTDFDIFSVQSGVASHNYSFRMYDARVLEWTFNNIMLPDSNVNEPASNGFVTFTVDQVPNLPNGTILENSAGIYFDFNAPIITNTSTHTINDGVVILDMTEPISKLMQLKVYPNPTDNVVTVELGDTQEFSITVLNQLGQVLHAQKATSNTSQVQLGQLPAGIYYLHIHDGQQTAVQKVIKQ